MISTTKYREFSGKYWDEYRYGYQGQEKDDEVKGQGNSINYKYRMHDPRIGRFFAVDPLSGKYPQWTPYQFSGNQVISTVELEGLEPEIDLNEAKENEIYQGEYNGVLYDYKIQKTLSSITEDGQKRYSKSWEQLGTATDYRTSGTQQTSEKIPMRTPEGSIISIKDWSLYTVDVGLALKGIPVVGEILTLSSLDKDKVTPLDAVPLPGSSLLSSYLDKKWDREVMEHGQRRAATSWDQMATYANRYNTYENTSVIFVYAAEDVHQNLIDKVPTRTIYKTKEEAKKALGFVPTIVYYKFITENTKSIVVSPYTKVSFP